MLKENAARMYKQIEQAYAKQERQKALTDPDSFIKLAAGRGYTFTIKDLELELARLSDEEIAGIFNPGIGPRRHLFPR